MTDQNFIDSNLKKIQLLLFQKNIGSLTFLSDEDDDLIDNVVYVEINENDHLGIYTNGTNPYFSQSFIEDIDLFNLYENYNTIKLKTKTNTPIRVNSIKLVFNSDYNEFLGLFAFNSEIKERSFSLIFKGDELAVFEDVTFENFKSELDSQLLHVERKKLYLLDSKNNNWTSENYGNGR